MKYCWNCKEVKQHTDFCKDKGRPDGYRGRCKNCDRIYRIKKREKNPQVYKEMSGRYYRKNREKKLEYLKKWRLENLHKTKAHGVVKTAMATGVLERKPCVECGSLNSDAHHEDYSKPLEVIWVCRTHHMRLHK